MPAVGHYPAVDQTSGLNLEPYSVRTTTSQAMPTSVETGTGSESQQSSMQYLKIRKILDKSAKKSSNSCVVRSVLVRKGIWIAFRDCFLLVREIGDSIAISYLWKGFMGGVYGRGVGVGV